MILDEKKLKKWMAVCIAVYFAAAVIIYAVGGEQFRWKSVETGESVDPAAITGELIPGSAVEQPFRLRTDVLERVTLKLAAFGRTNRGSLNVSIYGEGTEPLGSAFIPAESVADGADTVVTFDPPIETGGQDLFRLVVKSDDSAPGSALACYYGNSISLTRGKLDRSIAQDEKAAFDGGKLEGVLCFKAGGRAALHMVRYYGWCVLAGGMALLVYGLLLLRRFRAGKSSAILRLLSAFCRYRFLLRQLISREFKTKYKRSVLGVCWSFLNPLLTMLVQYIVFSTIFKSSIPNFALYLLIGIVCFSFFSEASNVALSSIVGNAGLITKVYVPKYIYPVSRVLSSTVNLLFSLIPLFLVILLTGTPLRPAAVLLPFGLICLGVFCMGLGLLLSSAMVFFRDTQFLWSVVSMLWMYATPIFYPDDIIPAHFMTVYKMNPLYHFIRFIRTILMDGVSPEPRAYFFCLIMAIGPLLIGALVFKKTQDKFVLHI